MDKKRFRRAFFVAALLLLLAPGVATAQEIRSKTFESVSPNGRVSIVSRCDGQRRACDVSAQTGRSTVDIGPRAYPAGPSIRWVNLDTAAVDFACGAECRTTWFYNPRMGLSAAYHGVLAVDGIRMRVAVANEQRREIEVFSIGAHEGGAPTCRIKRSWSQAGPFTHGATISNAVFGSDGKLKLHYAGAASGRVSEEIALDRDGAC